MKKKSVTTNFLVSIMVICTASIVLSNYIFSKQIVLNVDKQLLENEYNKIGGKENYNILKELQKQEMIGYLDKLRKEKPELIKTLKEKAENKETEETNKNIDSDFLNEIKQDTYIKGNTGALISVIEFSDLECDYCIKYHKKNINNQLLKKYPNKVNYIFKNFPLPKSKNSSSEAKAALCIKNISTGEKYLEFINKVYNTTTGGGEGFDLSKLPTLAEEIGVNKEDFENCYKNNLEQENAKKEFEQGLSLGINSVPSNVIINNTTGEYIIVSEMVDFEDIEEIVEELLE